MKDTSKLPRDELISLFSPSMSDIVKFQNLLRNVTENLSTLQEGDSLLLQSVAIQDIANFLDSTLDKKLERETLINKIDTKLKTNLSKLMKMIDSRIEEKEVERAGVNVAISTDEPEYFISGEKLQLNLIELKDNELYKILLNKITSDILIPGIGNIDAYIEKIIENVSRQPGQFVIVNVKRSNSWGGARKRTKRKKQKNNKVSQRKNRIKVKKHASRKFRAKGKSKKGRKL